MWRRTLFVSLILGLPSAAWAQSTPERLLPGGSQIYVRWDGVDAHRAVFEKSALGKMLKEDTGGFFEALWDYGMEVLDKAVAEKDPNAAKAIAFLKEVPGVLGSIARNGFLFAVELKSLSPPQVETFLGFTGSGGDKGTILPFVTKLTAMAQADVKQVKVGNRTINRIGNDAVRLGWWSEGDRDAIFVFGTEEPEAVAKAMDDRKSSLADSAAFKNLKSFKEFATWGRGYFDLPELLKMAAALAPGGGQLLDDLGLKGLGRVTFQSGFDGAAERSVVEIEMPGPRKGLLALSSKKTIKLSDLPPLPADVTSFSASNFNVGSIYDAGLQIAEAAVKVFAPDEAGNVKELVKQVEALIGIKLGDDLFHNFGDLFVSYSSPAEGPLGLGGLYVFKLKDADKVAGTLESLFKSIPALPGAEITLKKTKYHGGEIMEVRVNTGQGEISGITFGVHKGWLLLGNFPQPIQGFILRSKGELPTWKASADVTKALAAFPKEFTSIAISDPRAGVKFFLSAFPSLLYVSNNILPQVMPGMRPFDVSTIPHAEYAVRHLFPNISVTTDDGKKIRIETRASLALPF